MKSSALFPLSAFALGCWLSVPVAADVSLPKVLDSGMVLQQEAPVRVWGTADAGEEVSVTLGDATESAKADGDGAWMVTLPAQQADGEARQIVVQGANKLVLEDVLVGEVWIGSGQSNMEWPLRSTQGADQAAAEANYPQIRLFHVPRKQEKAPAADVDAQWRECSPQTVPGFSAVLYYFGKKLHEELGVPVGLINSSWGGSPIEPWTVGPNDSGGMYNGMIAPLTNLSVQGAIWYQGETNVLRKDGPAYADKMKALIEGWRAQFNDPQLDFYFVQIAPWSGRYEPGELPKLWEAQAASLKIPRTGMVVTTDLVDNIADIHPRNKKDVGERLARWALAKNYGRELVYSGPLYQSMQIDGSQVRLKFAHLAEGLESSDGGPLREFEIAGESGKFVAAKAEIDGQTVVVSSDKVASPKQVRFAWHKVAKPNLVNSAGLPASPFQTDGWSGGTGIEP